MCGPITAAFALSSTQSSKWQQFRFHLLLNLGRILSYVLIGAGIGALGSVLVAGGQMAGIGSSLRRGMALLTGILLIWLGLGQIRPGWLPKLPFFHPLIQSGLHQTLNQGMLNLSFARQWWTPFALGAVWGLIPCGFLYAAQIKAAETGSLITGGITMLAFGLGTFPTMLGVGVSASLLSADRRSQLFRMGGWVTLLVGILTLLRTGNTMVDYTGHAALICLVLALLARPMSRLWSGPLHYRRALGVGAFVLSLFHTLHMVEHAWHWNLQALFFLLPQQQWGMIAGAVALLLMLPAALTSFDRAQRRLGTQWRRLHLLAVPALILVAGHAVLVGSHYLGAWQLTVWHRLAAAGLIATTGLVILLRLRWFWSLLLLEKFYASPQQK